MAELRTGSDVRQNHPTTRVEAFTARTPTGGPASLRWGTIEAHRTASKTSDARATQGWACGATADHGEGSGQLAAEVERLDTKATAAFIQLGLAGAAV